MWEERGDGTLELIDSHISRVLSMELSEDRSMRKAQ